MPGGAGPDQSRGGGALQMHPDPAAVGRGNRGGETPTAWADDGKCLSRRWTLCSDSGGEIYSSERGGPGERGRERFRRGRGLWICFLMAFQCFFIILIEEFVFHVFNLNYKTSVKLYKTNPPDP